jgi:hypothetical protein
MLWVLLEAQVRAKASVAEIRETLKAILEPQ